MAFSYNLLPPIILDAMPAFTGDSTRIYFFIGQKNNVHTLQYSISNTLQIEETNFGFKTSKEIYATIDKRYQEYGDHFIEIDTSNFKRDIFYKIQLRVSQVSFAKTSQISYNTFSEWSSVCLLKKINQPTLSIEEMGTQNSLVTKIIGIPLSVIKGKFNFHSDIEKLKTYQIKIYNQDRDYLTLQTDILSPVNNTNNEINYILPINLNQGERYKLTISYLTSSGYAGQSFFYFQSASQTNEGAANQFGITIEPDIDLGEMKITITSPSVTMENIIIRRTSSDTRFNYWEDIHIGQFNPKNLPTATYEYVWKDKTIKSGIYYNYGVAILKKNGWRGVFYSTQEPQQCLFEDMYLLNDNKSLKVRFNPTINDFKYNVNESVKQTLGAKFPFVNRNGHNFYRSFSIGGLITSYMDTNIRASVPSSQEIDFTPSVQLHNELNNHTKTKFGNFIPGPDSSETKNFTSKYELYGIMKDKYENYNEENNIQQHEDIIYEREFREAVTQFLYKNTIKLFRSMQEGNMLIKLTNISLSPVEQLGRHLYSFSATAIEIDEYSVLNCDKYNIQRIGDYEEIQITKTIPGQLVETFTTTSENLIDKIKRYFDEGKVLTLNNIISPNVLVGDEQIYDISVKKIYNLRIEIDSFPSPVSALKTYVNDTQASKATPLGYLMEINGQPVIIKAAVARKNENGQYKTFYVGTYDLPSGIAVTDLKVIGPTTEIVDSKQITIGPKEISVSINYVADVSIKKAQVNRVNIINFENPGQLWGTFKPNEHLRAKIAKKINYKYSDYIDANKSNNRIKQKINQTKLKVSTVYCRQLNNLWSVSFEGPENAVIMVQTKECTNNTQFVPSTNFDRHILANGYLNLDCNELTQITPYTENEETHERTYEEPYYEYQQNSFIQDFYFAGIHLIEKPLSQQQNSTSAILRKTQFRYDTSGQTYYNFESVTEPLDNVVYHFESVPTYNESNAAIVAENNNELTVSLGSENYSYIYYNKQWYPFNESSNDVLCPVDAIVTYYYQGSYYKAQLA